MKTLYLDIFSGISGDMFLGALLDLGLPLPELERELDKLGLEGYHLHATRSRKAGIAGVKFDVHLNGDGHGSSDHHHDHDHDHDHDHGHPHHDDHEHDHDHDHLHDHGPGHHHPADHSHEHDAGAHSGEPAPTFTSLRKLIAGSTLSEWVKAKSIAVFHRIATAEGKIHGLPPEHVHFHEVGAIDSVVDIVGGCIGLDLLGRPRVLAGPVVEGVGWIQCAHGRFPIPAPATLAILGARGVALSQCDEPHELVTPTGAALLAEFAEDFGPMRALVADKIGFGLGGRDHETRPNVLRAVLGQSAAHAGLQDWERDTVAVLQTNVDDLSPEILGSFIDKALAAGALDVFHTPVQMKKNRPGVLLTVLCPESDADRFTELILRETTSFGVRRTAAERRKLARESINVPTLYGEVSVKIGRLNGQRIQAAPEFESCRKVAEQAKVPIKDVYAAVLKALPG